MKTETRGYVDQSGKRTTLRFEPETWQAIDHVAKASGQSWSEWANGVPARYENNRHADIRVALVGDLQKVRARQFQACDLFANIEAPLLRNAQVMTDKQLGTDLKDDATFVDDTGAMNFGGFTLRTGTRQGAQCVWVQNNLRDAPHVMIPFGVAVQAGNAA